MSLLGSRRFLGDYLGVNATTGFGSQIRNAANLGSNERAVFSCRAELLEHKFGRSSKLSPRIIVVTNSKFYIIAQMLVSGQPSISIEKGIPLGAIKFIGTSTCQDDWFSLGIGSQQEPDPLMTCIFKTEMFTQMQRVMPGGFNLKIADTIEYAKKPGKMQQVKVLKDSQQRADFYKSGAIHTQQGEPPSSVSRPTPKGKPVPPKPITRGKLIKPGGPNGRPSRLQGNRTAKPRPGASSARTVPQPPAAVSAASNAAASAAVPKATPIANTSAAIPSHTRNQNSTGGGATRAPPPPPAAPPAPSKIMAKVLYDFAGQTKNELSISAGDMIEIVQKENNGWWLAKTAQGQAWVPATYVEEQRPPPPPPAAKAKPAPPAPPAKRPAAARKPADLQQRDSGMSLNGASSSTDNSRSTTPQPSLGGSLADALLARKNAMQQQKNDANDDW